MSDRSKATRVRGVDVAPVALDVLGWREAGVFWRLEFFGHRLWREGELVAEGVSTIRDAVLWAKAWESCLAHAKRLHAMQPKAFDAYLSRVQEDRELWQELRERDVISEQPRLANGETPAGDGGGTPEVDPGS